MGCAAWRSKSFRGFLGGVFFAGGGGLRFYGFLRERVTDCPVQKGRFPRGGRASLVAIGAGGAHVVRLMHVKPAGAGAGNACGARRVHAHPLLLAPLLFTWRCLQMRGLVGIPLALSLATAGPSAPLLGLGGRAAPPKLQPLQWAAGAGRCHTPASLCLNLALLGRTCPHLQLHFQLALSGKWCQSGRRLQPAPPAAPAPQPRLKRPRAVAPRL